MFDHLIFYKDVAECGELREAATEAARLVDNHNLAMSMRPEVHQAKLNAKSKINLEGTTQAEDSRLVEEMILDGKRCGLFTPGYDLCNVDLDEVEALQRELDITQITFNVSFISDSLHRFSRVVFTGKLQRRECMLSTIDHMPID